MSYFEVWKEETIHGKVKALQCRNKLYFSNAMGFRIIDPGLKRESGVNPELYPQL